MVVFVNGAIFVFLSRSRHTRSYGDWSSDVCSSDLLSRESSSLAEAKRAPRRAVSSCFSGNAGESAEGKPASLKTTTGAAVSCARPGLTRNERLDEQQARTRARDVGVFISYPVSVK